MCWGVWGLRYLTRLEAQVRHSQWIVGLSQVVLVPQDDHFSSCDLAFGHFVLRLAHIRHCSTKMFLIKMPPEKVSIGFVTSSVRIC